MDYTLHYDIAAMVILAVVGVLFYSRKYFPSPSNKAFSLLCGCLFFSSMFDALSSYTRACSDTVPLIWNYLCCVLYYFFYVSCSLLYLNYTINLTKAKNSAICKFFMWFVRVALVVNGLLFATTHFTHWIFYFDSNRVYTHGPLYFILFPLSILEIFGALVLTITARKRMTLMQKLINYLFVGAVISSIVLQLNYPNMQIANFFGAVLVVMIMQTLQNPAEYINAELGVYNQRAFMEMLDMQFKKHRKLTVLAFQLEGFQFIDQFMGVENGNQLLTAVAEDCSDNMQGKLYHLEGTQFAMIMEADSPKIQDNVEWLDWRFLSTFKVCGVAVSLIPRICAVNYPEIAKTKEEMTNAISYTFQMAKEANSTDIVWATTQAIENQKRNTMVTHILNRAVLNREFEVYYQPIYCTRDNSFRAAEALIRLNDEELGYISPDEFIPLAEKSGLILEIGDIVFEKVCEFISTGIPQKYGVQYIEVNLSVVQCMQENLHRHLTNTMDKHKIPYHMIDFEITETFASGDTCTLVKNMTELISLGCTFAMDDYGTGFSNTDYLMEFPFKLIKLDKSFIWSALSNQKANKILAHTAAMIKSLDLLIVAEGVETKEQAQILKDLNCDYLQGYYYSKPIPLEDYISYLEHAEDFLKKLEGEGKESKKETVKEVKKRTRKKSKDIEIEEKAAL